MNIIRVKFPDRTIRLKPFTVGEYRDMLLIRNEMRSNEAERKEIFDEMLAEIFPDLTPFEREHAFVVSYVESIGKGLIDATFTCPVCGSKHRLRLKITQARLKTPELQVNNITFKFKLPDVVEEPDVMFEKTIDRIFDGENEYNWSDLGDYQEALMDMISFDEFKDIAAQFRPVHVRQEIFCCKQHVIEFTTAQSIFEMLVSADEIFNFYQINRALVRNEYTMADVLSMFPVERSIVLSLVEKELKEKK